MISVIFGISAETMGRAGLNTALGIGIVFLMLIIISCIISLLKLANRPEKKAPAAPAPKAASVEADETDDLELIAVISAAICAYEQAQGNAVSSDSLVVRSIRKVNKSKWQNA